MNYNASIPAISISSRPTARSVGATQSPPPSPASAACRPLCWLGAKSEFGLALPAAKPSRTQLYAPRGICLTPDHLIVADSGNHRLLIWNSHPHYDGQPADIVIGQPSFESEGPAQGRQCYERGMHLPTGVIVAESKLLVADAWHHRILVWNEFPSENNTKPDQVIGQGSLVDVLPNRGGRPCGNSLYWPYGLAYIDGRLYVADTGNRRVLVWQGVPTVNRPADAVLGQPDFFATDENRGGAPCANSFRWPHAIAGNANGLWVADAGNHRVLGWQRYPQSNQPADWVIGQNDMQSNAENPYCIQGNRALRFPYGLAIERDHLLVADTANNRLLSWRLPVEQAAYAGAADVIGQPDFDQCGENRWLAVTDQTLCWPYGVAVCGDQVAIADSGNNRVMLWNCRPLLESNIAPDKSVGAVKACV